MGRKYTNKTISYTLFKILSGVLLMIIGFKSNAQIVFFEDFGTSTVRLTSPYMPAGSFAFGDPAGATWQQQAIENNHYAVIDPTRIADAWPANQYWLWTGPLPSNTFSGSATPVVQDHTPSDVNGAVMAINAGTTLNTFYNRDVVLEAGACYEFSYWIYTVNSSTGVQIELRDVADADNQAATTSLLSNAIDYEWSNSSAWRKVTYTFNFPVTCVSKNVSMRLKNAWALNSGNDYYIDDITLQKISSCAGAPSPTCPVTVVPAAPAQCGCKSTYNLSCTASATNTAINTSGMNFFEGNWFISTNATINNPVNMGNGPGGNVNPSSLKVCSGTTVKMNQFQFTGANQFHTIEIDEGSTLELTLTSTSWDKVKIVNNGTLIIHSNATDNGNLSLNNNQNELFNNGTAIFYGNDVALKVAAGFTNSGVMMIRGGTGNLTLNNNNEKLCLTGGSTLDVQGYIISDNDLQIKYGGVNNDKANLIIRGKDGSNNEITGNLNNANTGFFNDAGGNFQYFTSDGNLNMRAGITSTSTASTVAGTCATLASCVAPSPAITYTVAVTNTSTCLLNDGKLTFNGLVASTPYTITYFKDGVSQTASFVTNASGVGQITGLAPGTYTQVTVTRGCISKQSTSTFVITAPPLPTATVSGTAVVCLNDASPNITFTGATGTAPYTFTYNVNGGANQTITTTAGNSVNIAVPTTSTGVFVYNLVSVSDSKSCSQTQTGSATITVTPAPTVVSTVNYCLGASATALTATGTSLKWYTVPTGGTALASAPVPSTAIAGATTYYVTQTIGTCESPRAPIDVVVTDPSTGINVEAISASCVGNTLQNNASIYFTHPAGSAIRYSISAGATYTGGVTTYAAATALSAGTNTSSSALPNPATSQVYTVRLFTNAPVTNCYKDLNVTLYNATCGATCNGTLGPELFPGGDFGTTATLNTTTWTNPGGSIAQPNSTNHPGVVIGPPLGAGVTNYTFGLNAVLTGPNNQFFTIPDDGNYVVTNSSKGMLSPPSSATTWAEIVDNDGTSSTLDGYFMLVNASTTPDIFYKKTVSVCQGQKYNISFDIASLCNNSSNLPNVSLVIAPNTTSATDLLTYPASYSSGPVGSISDHSWKSNSFVYTVPPGVSSLTFAFRNNNVGGSGNDLGLDNLSMRFCGPLLTAIDPNPIGCVSKSVTMGITLTNNNFVSPVYQWQKSTDGGISWANVAGATSTNYTIASIVAADAGLYRLLAAESGNITNTNCRIVSSNITLNVYSLPTLNSANTATSCSGNVFNYTATSATSGTTFSWTRAVVAGISNTAGSGVGATISETLVNTTSAAVNVTYVVSMTANGCTNTQNVIVTVNPMPSISLSAIPDVCLGTTSTSLPFTATTASPNQYTIDWNAAANTAGIADVTNAVLPASPIIISGLSAIAAGSYTGTITVRNTTTGCISAPQTISFTINVLPTITLSAISDICFGTNTTTLPFTATSGSPNQYSIDWNNAANTAGIVDVVNSALPVSPIAISGLSAVAAATYNGNISVKNTTTGCVSNIQPITFTINPIPTVVDPADQTLCNNAVTTAVNFSGTVAGTVFNWVNTNSSIGLAASGNTNIAAFNVINTGTASQTATVTVTPVSNGCTGSPQSFTILVKPTPTVADPADQVLCNNASSSAVTFTGTVTGTVFDWVNNNTSIGLAASGTSNIGGFVVTNTGSVVQTATVTVTPTLNGCTGTPQTFTITVNPTPTVADPADQIVCNNTSTAAVAFSGTVTGTVFNWTNNNTGIGLAASGNTNIASYTAINLGTSNQVATVTVTPTANGCAGTPQSFSITVKPTPNVIAAPASQSVCNNTAITAVNFTSSVAGTTFAWTNNNTSIGLAASGSSNIASFTAVNTGTADVTASFTVTPTANGCPGPSQTFTITVKPTPNVVTTPPSQTVCNNTSTSSVSFTGSVVGTVYNWTNNNTSVGLAASGIGDVASFTAINTGTTVNVATITVTPVANGCSGSSQNFTITVNPTPTVVAAPANQTICTGVATVAVNFTSAVTSTSFSWTNNNATIGLAASGTGNIASFTSLNSSSTTQVASITVTPTANTCPGASQIFTISVLPRPTVADPADQINCSNTSTATVNFVGTVTGTVFNWTNNNTSIGLVAAGNTDISSFTASNTGTSVQVATVSVVPTANGCTGPAQTFTYTVNPIPTAVAAPSSQTVCSGTATTAINFTSPVAGTTFGWSNNDTSIGLATSGSGNIASFTATNTGTVNQVATITVTPSASSCPGTAQAFTITVHPRPTVVDPADQTICNNAATAQVTFTGSVAGTVFNWVNDNATIGLAASGIGDIASFTATNSGSVVQSANVTVTPVANSCTGTPQTFRYTVNPTPTTVITPANQVLCNNTSTATITFSGAVAGTVYTWTNDNASIGLAASGSGNIASFNAVNLGAAIQVANITVAASANSCGGAVSTFTITVNPTPSVVQPTNQSLCNNTSTSAINFTGSVAGTVFNWTNNNTSIGLAAAGNTDIAAFTAINNTGIDRIATVSISPTANGCVGGPFNFTYTVHPTPTVLPQVDQLLCNTSATAAINFTGNVVTASYNWTNDNASIGLAASGTGNIASFLAVNSGMVQQLATITVTPTISSCSGTPETFTVTVNPSPTVADPSDQVLCGSDNSAAVTFVGTVASTTYNWTNTDPTIGLTASGNGDISSFMVSNTTNANKVATITVTPSADGCNGTAQNFTITVRPEPVFTSTHTNPTTCAGADGTITISGLAASLPYSVSYNSGAFVPYSSNGSGQILLSGLAAGNYVNITVRSAIGCTSDVTGELLVAPFAPTIDAGNKQIVCEGTSVTVTATASGGATISWDNGITNGVSFTPLPGTRLYTASATLSGCTSSDTVTVIVNETPDVNVPSNQVLCNSAMVAAINFTGSVAGTVFNWTNDNTSIGLAASNSGNIAGFAATNAGSTGQLATVTVSPTANGCPGPASSFTILVHPTPTMVDPADQLLCDGASTTSVTFTSAVSGTAFNWINNNASIGLGNSGLGNIASFAATNSGTALQVATVTVTPTANLCVGASQDFTISVRPTPTVVDPADQVVVCNNGPTTAVNFSGSVVGTVFNWVNNNTSIGLAASGNTDIASFNGTNAGSAIQTATITVTPTASSCVGTPQSFTIVVHPTTTMTDPTDQSRCNNGATNAVTFVSPVSGTVFNWVNDNSSIGLGASGTGNLASFTAINVGTAIQTANITVTPNINGCIGTPQTFTISVSPTPNVVDPADQVVICNNGSTNAVIFAGNVPGTTYSWINDNTSIGLAASGNTNIASFVATNSGVTIQTSNITVAPSLNTCTGTPQTFSIVVHPTTSMTAIADQNICDGASTASVNFVSPVAGTVFNWTNDNTSVGLLGSGVGNIASFVGANNGTSVQVANVTVVPSVNGCPGVTRNFSIVVNPIPNVAQPLNQVLCNNASTSAINFSGNVPGTVYNWTNDNTTIGLGASGNNNISAFTVQNNGVVGQVANVSVTPTFGTCVGVAQPFTITVNPTPTVTDPADQTLCSGASVNAVNFVGTVASTVFNWINDNTSTGLAASGNSNIPSFVGVNSGTVTQTSNVVVTPVANNCIGTAQSFTVTVNPIPTVADPTDQVRCANATVAATNFSGSVIGTVFNWTNDNTSIGLAASGNTNIASFSGINSGVNVQTAKVTVIPSFGTCLGSPNDFTITINPTPVVADPADQVLCNGSTTATVTFTGTVSGTVFNWTNNNTLIGLGAAGNTDIASFATINTGTVTQVANVVVTPTANACTGASQNFIFTVNPTPSVANPSDQVRCNGASTAAVVFSGNVSGTTFNWVNDNASVGLALSGNTNIASFNALNTGTVAVTANITVTPTANTCVGTPQTFSILVNPTPTVNDPADQVLCNGVSTATVNFTSLVPSTVFDWVNNNTTIGLAASGQNDIASFAANNAGNISQTANITVSPTANGCVGTSQSFTILVNPTPTVVANPDNQIVCSNSNTTPVVFSSSVSGTAFSWTNDNTSIGLAATGNTNIGAFTAINNVATDQVANITVTPTANTCGGAPHTFTITVRSATSVADPADQVVCNNAATAFVNFSGTIFTWTNDNTSIGLAASGNANLASFTAVNTSTIPQVATITVMPLANSCSGTPQTFTITVNPTPVMIDPADQKLCNASSVASVTYSSTVTGTVFSWTNDNNTIGLASSGNGDIASFVAQNTGVNNQLANINVVPTANGCVGKAEAFQILVNPTPTVAKPLDQILCKNTPTKSVVFAGTVSGTVFNWINDNTNVGLGVNGSTDIASFTALNSTILPDTAHVIVTPSANGCVGSPANFIFVVNPTPGVVLPVDQIICNNTSTVNLNFTGTTAGTTFGWTNDNTNIGLAASGTGNIASFVGLNPGTTANTSTITVSPLANGCSGLSQSFKITVNPTPVVSQPVDQTLCNSLSSNMVVFNSSVAGTVFDWTNDNKTIGLDTMGVNNIQSFVAINNTLLPITANVTVTPTADGCQGNSKIFKFTVNPTPNVAPIVSQVVCNNTQTAAINFGGTVSGTVFNWVNDNSTVGLASSGNTNIAGFTALNPATVARVANVTVTPVANNCIGSPQTFTITVNPTPIVAQPINQVLCNNASTSAVVFTGSVVGTVFNWTNDNTSIGLASVGATDIASFTAINTGTVAQNASVVVTPSANACIGLPMTFMISVKPTPNVTMPIDQTICNNVATATVNFTGAVASTVFDWINDNTSVGLAASGNTDITSFNATNISSIAQVANISVTPTSNGCSGSPASFRITVNPTPTVADPADQVVCNNLATSTVNFAGTVASTTFNWINDNTSIGLNSNGNSDIASFVATNTGNVIQTATVTVTPSANNCVGTSQIFTIRVNPTPSVQSFVNQVVCNNVPTTSVNFVGSVASSTFGWSNNNTSIGLGASGNTDINSFIATNTGNVSQIATITVTPTANSCLGSPQVFTITVNPTPSVSDPADQILCNNSATQSVNFAGTVLGTVYDWTNTNTSIGLLANGNTDIVSFVATNSGATIQTSTINVTPTANGCQGLPQNFSITVNPTPNVVAPADQTLCNSSSTNAVLFVGNVANTQFNWSNDNTIIGLGASGVSDIPSFATSNLGATALTANISVTPSANGCTGISQSFTILVNPTPSVSIPASQIVCNNSTTSLVSFTGTVSGTTFGWVNDNTNIGLAANGSGDIASFTGLNTGSVAAISTITVSPLANNCSGLPQSFKITVNPTPSVVQPTNQILCNNASTSAVTFAGSVAGTIFNWTNDNTNIGLAATGNTNIQSFVAANTTSAPIVANVAITPIAQGCQGLPNTFTFTVNPTPNVAPIASQVVCNNAQTAAINFGGNVLGTVFNWVNDNSTIGLASSGNANIAGFAALNPTTVARVANVTVTPVANNCIGSPQNFQIKVNITPVVDAGQSFQICEGQSTSLKAVNPSAASITWDNSVIDNIAFVPMVGVNKYKVLASLNNCTNADSIIVTVNSKPVVTLRDTAVCRSLSVSLTPNVTKATGALTYAWSPNLALNDVVSATVVASPLTTTAYTVEVTDSKACKDTASANVTVTLPPSLTVMNDTMLCSTVASLGLTANASNYASISWTGGKGSFNNNSILTPTYDFVGADVTNGEVELVVTANRTVDYCFSVSKKVKVKIESIAVVDAGADREVCADVKSLPLLGTSTTGLATWSIGLGSGSFVSNASVLTNSYAPSASDAVSGTVKLFLQSNAGTVCPFVRDSVKFTFVPLAAHVPQNYFEFCNYDKNELTLNAGPAVNYMWSTGKTTESINITEEGNYEVTKYNRIGCPTLDTIKVSDDCGPRFFLPDAFTPGSSDEDNLMEIFGRNFINLELVVFNRWGEVVYYTTDRNKPWDGKYKGEYVESGLYPYKVSYEGKNAKYKGPYSSRGSVMVYPVNK